MCGNPSHCLDVDPDLGAAMTPERFAMARHEARGDLAHAAPWRVVAGGARAAQRRASGAHRSRRCLRARDRARGHDQHRVARAGRLHPPLVRGGARACSSSACAGRCSPRCGSPSWADPSRRRVAGTPSSARRSRTVRWRAPQRLATTHAISHLNSVERRVCALLWHLAERWGRVTRDGIVVPLTLSHRLLGELVGARRPTVSTALAALERQGKVRRREDATWLLPRRPARGAGRTGTSPRLTQTAAGLPAGAGSQRRRRAARARPSSLARSVQRGAPGHGDDVGGDVAGFLRGQEHVARGELGGLRGAAHRRLRAERLDLLSSIVAGISGVHTGPGRPS